MLKYWKVCWWKVNDEYCISLAKLLKFLPLQVYDLGTGWTSNLVPCFFPLLNASGYIACSLMYSKCWNGGVGSSYCAHPSFLAVLIPDLQLHWTTRMPSLEMKRPWLHMGLFLGTWYVWFLKMTCRHLTYLHLQIQSIPHFRIMTNLLWLPAHIRLASLMNNGVILPKDRPPSLMPGMMTVWWVLKMKRWNRVIDKVYWHFRGILHQSGWLASVNSGHFLFNCWMSGLICWHSNMHGFVVLFRCSLRLCIPWCLMFVSLWFLTYHVWALTNVAPIV